MVYYLLSFYGINLFIILKKQAYNFLNLLNLFLKFYYFGCLWVVHKKRREPGHTWKFSGIGYKVR